MWPPSGPPWVEVPVGEGHGVSPTGSLEKAPGETLPSSARIRERPTRLTIVSHGFGNRLSPFSESLAWAWLPCPRAALTSL